MSRLPSRRLVAVLAMAACGAASAQTPAPPSPALSVPARQAGLSLDLNKLEPAPGGCRAYFVAENRTRETVAEIQLDTFVFDAAGVIIRRIGLTFPDIRAGRTKVVPFDLASGGCGEIKRLLVNEIIACTGAAGAPLAGCGDLLAVSSRTTAAFEY